MKIVKPNRATRTYKQQLVGAPEAVFPLAASPTGSEADITYSHTSLGPRGDEFVASFMRDWESRINHFLTHGAALPAAASEQLPPDRCDEPDH